MRLLAVLATCTVAACASSVTVPDTVTLYEVPPAGYDLPPTTGTASSFGGESYGTAGAGLSNAPLQTAPGLNPSGTQIGDDRLNLAEFSLEQQRIDAALAEQKLEEARRQLVVVSPSGVPTEQAGANVALYAQQSSNQVGERIYPRNGGIRLSSNCGRYREEDDAQRAFLAAGGPATDSLRLDPDGDGFACGWDPAPYRALR
jgi:hypothetical protein